MNERAIQFALLSNVGAQSLVLPNYTPAGWWECDLCELTKSGYFREYEIKLSLSDFKADSKKFQTKYDWRNDIEHPNRVKHDLLAAGDLAGPSKFWYVAPAGVLALDLIPSWAGLIEVSRLEGSRYLRCKEVRSGPRIHKHKVDEKFSAEMYRTGYNRYRFGKSFNEDLTSPTTSA